VPRDGAEAEWVGETHDSLTVRHEDPAVAKTVKQMLVERYPNRTALLASIGETRGPGGFAVQYRDGHPVLPADRIWRMDLEVDNTDADDFSDLVGVTGNVDVDGGTFTAPVLAKTGNVVVVGETGKLKSVRSTLHAKLASARPKLVPPDPLPRYAGLRSYSPEIARRKRLMNGKHDEVFEEGVRALDADAGEPLVAETGEQVFDLTVRKSREGND